MIRVIVVAEFNDGRKVPVAIPNIRRLIYENESKDAIDNDCNKLPIPIKKNFCG